MLNLGLQLYRHHPHISMQTDQDNSQRLSISSNNKPPSSQSLSSPIQMVQKNPHQFDHNTFSQSNSVVYRPQTISQILSRSEKASSQNRSNFLKSMSNKGVRGISGSIQKLGSIALKMFESRKKEQERSQIITVAETKKKVVFDANYWSQFAQNLKQNLNCNSEKNNKRVLQIGQSSYQEISLRFFGKEPTRSSQINDSGCSMSFSSSDRSRNDQDDSIDFENLQKNEYKRGPSFQQYLKRDPSDQYEKYCQQKQNVERNKISQMSQREVSNQTAQSGISEFKTELKKSTKQKKRQSKWRKNFTIDEDEEENHKQDVKKLNKGIEKKKIYCNERIIERVKLPEVFKPKSNKYTFDSSKIIKIVKNEVARSRQEQQRKQEEEMRLQQRQEAQSQKQSSPEKDNIGFGNALNSSVNNFSNVGNKKPHNSLAENNSQKNIEGRQQKKQQGESNKSIFGNSQLFSGNAFSNSDKNSLALPENAFKKDKNPESNAQDSKPATKDQSVIPHQSNQAKGQQKEKQNPKNEQKKEGSSQLNPFLSSSPAKGLNLKNLIGIKNDEQGLKQPEDKSQGIPKFSTPSKNIQDKANIGSASRIPLIHQGSHQKSEQPSFNDSQMEDESQQDDKNLAQKTSPQNMFGLQNSMNSTPVSFMNNGFQNNSFIMNQPNQSTFSVLSNQQAQPTFNQNSFTPSLGQTNLSMPNINPNASFPSSNRQKCLQLFKPTSQINNQSTLFGQTAPPMNSNDSSRKNRQKKKQQRAFA